MSMTNINIRMDSELKNQFNAFCEDMGMSMTTAFTIFAKKTVREYRIPFEIGSENPNEDTLKAFQETDEILKNSDQYKGYTDVHSMFEELLS